MVHGCDIGDEVVVGFSKLSSSEKDMRIHQDSTNNILGVSYDASARWKRKTMRARVCIGILTIALTTLIVLLILALEMQLYCRHNSNSSPKVALKDSVKFLIFTDYHFDSYYNESISAKPTSCRRLGNYSNADYKAHYGRINCDSPGTLIDNMLDAIKKQDGASFVLMTGDFSAHNMDKSYFDNKTSPATRTLKNIETAVSKTKTAFPNIPIFPMLGNNDLPGHYVIPISTDWYVFTLAFFAPLILCKGCPDSVPRPTNFDTLRKTFRDGGYYSVNVTNTNGRMMLLVLNTLYWNGYANKIAHGNPLVQAVAMRQMTWLEEQLEQAKQKNQRVFISGHIPPGIDPYNGENFWLSNYTDMYVKLVAGKYKDIIAGQFYSHIHKDDFHLQVMDTKTPVDNESPTNKSFVLLIPSVSPIYSNNPAFRVGYIDADKQVLLDYDQFYMDLVMATQFNTTRWQFAYRFSERYPSSNPYIDAERIYQLNQQLIDNTNDKTWINYVFARTLFYQPASYSRFALYCAMRYVSDSDYKKCVQKFNVPGG